MDHRRRPSHARLAAACLVLLASAPWMPGHAAIEFQTAAEELRLRMPDTLYAAGVTADFSNLNLRSETGATLDFAACPIQEQVSEKRQVPVLALPDLARPLLDAEGRLSFERPAGAGPADSLKAWIVDLRALDTPVRELSGVPAISEMRDSPNLQQWGAPLPFRQHQTELQIEARPLKFVRLKPAATLGWPQPLPLIEVAAQGGSGQRQAHWYQPDINEQGYALHTRRLPVFAARLRQPPLGAEVTLQSRQGPWDAWKPRGQWQAVQADQVLRFSAVSDPQWRLLGAPQAKLELAHAAHELRATGLEPGQRLWLGIGPAGRRSTGLSCATTEHIGPLSQVEFRSAPDPAADGDGTPANIRRYFLLIVAFVIVALIIWRRRSKPQAPPQ